MSRHHIVGSFITYKHTQDQLCTEYVWSYNTSCFEVIRV